VPVLFVCENNLYAMGTALKYSHAVTNLELKGAAYGITSSSVDGMDLHSVLTAATMATNAVRKTGKPYFLICNTYRFRAHSMFDAELYREKSEVEEWKKRDPIPSFSIYLLNNKLITEAELQVLQTRIETEVNKAVDFAEAGTWESVDNLTRYVYSESNN
jgi:pyruvate dehydrogenase E1 component alpha subunit